MPRNINNLQHKKSVCQNMLFDTSELKNVDSEYEKLIGDLFEEKENDSVTHSIINNQYNNFNSVKKKKVIFANTNNNNNQLTFIKNELLYYNNII